MKKKEKLCNKCHEEFAAFDDYCIDCWPGYDNCADPKCHHFRCEHGVVGGTPMKVIYSKTGSPPVGSIEDWGEGCWNAGCKCKKFAEKET